MRALLHLACGLPMLVLAVGYLRHTLGVDPEKSILWETGIWAFNLLILALALPHAARWARWPALIRYRRAMGLWAFAYINCHLLAFVTFLLAWDVYRLGEEILERPYILVGFSAWLTLVPLAITSTRGWIQRLGTRWKRLHSAAYIALALAAVHYFLTVRSDYAWAGGYALIAIVLLVSRWLTGKRAKTAAMRSQAPH